MKKITLILLSFLLPLITLAQNSNDTVVIYLIDTSKVIEGDVFVIPDDSPEFPGGDIARIKFIEKNLVYPEALLKAGIEGTVYVKFIVEKDGSFSNFKVMREIGDGSGEEVIRVIKLMPNWIPGKQNGKVVRTQFILPVKFSIK